MKLKKMQSCSIRMAILLLVIFFHFNFTSVYSQVTINVPNPNNTTKWDIYELTFNSNDNIYNNPFWDVDISGTFTGPNSESLYTEGFYYDKDTWKLRFSPISVGAWKYKIAFKTANNTYNFEGNFDCLSAKVNNHGFITKSSTNQHNFIYSDGKPYIINGINGHTPAVTAAFLGIPNSPPPADAQMTTLMWQYLASKNVNSYRLQMFHQNWAPPVMSWNQYEGHANLLQNSGSLDKYDLANAKLIDKWIKKAEEYGINLYPCLFTIHNDDKVFFFNQSPWSIQNGGFYTDPTNMYTSISEPGHSYVKKYVRYIINRYGAYHNILAWEYNNEWGKYTSKEWINSIDAVITKSDPYNRAHVVSYWGYDYSFDSDLHNLPSNQIVDFHVYPWVGTYTEFTIDKVLNEQISFFYNKLSKPVNIGELGSGDSQNNIPPEGHYFDRIGYWTSFISGGAALYWLRGDNTTTGINYNKETLEWIKNFGLITSKIRNYSLLFPQLNRVSTSNNASIRTYCLGNNSNEYIFFIHHYSNHSNSVSNEKLHLAIPDASWEINWFEPNTGTLINSKTIDSKNGIIDIDIPVFTIDLVLYIYSSSPIIILSANSLTISANTNSQKSFDIFSNINWTVACNQTWLTVNSPTGSNNSTLTLTVTANPTTSTRSATVTVSGTGAKAQIITVTQDPAAAVLAVSANTMIIAAPANSTKTFDVTSNINWTAVSDQSWLTISSGSGSGNATLTLTATANPTTSTRSATVTVSGTGATAQIITVTQDPAAAVLAVSANIMIIAAPANSTKTFDITSNINWTAVSDQSWLTISSGSGSGNATLTLTATANPTTPTRSAIVTVSGTGATAQIFTVTQDAGTTGINEINNNSASLFPNPVTNELTINNISQNTIISIYDLTGRLIINKMAKSTIEKIDVSRLTNGVYSIKVTVKKAIKTCKFVKQ